MGSIFLPRYTGKDGSKKAIRIWWLKYRDATGRLIRESSKLVRETDARRLLRVREGRAAAGLPPLRPHQAPPRNVAEARLGVATMVLDIAAVKTPLVYAVVGPDSRVRYIGMSRVGLERPINHKHRAYAEAAIGDRLFVWSFPTAQQAAEAELNLIAALCPNDNRAVPSASLINIEQLRGVQA